MPIRPLLISVLLTVSLLGSPAHAQQAYFGGNFALMNYDTATLNPSIDLNSVYGRAGFSDKRGIFRGELRLGFITGEEDGIVEALVMDGSSDEINATLEVSGTLLGFYALVGMPAESTVRPYAFLGYSLTDWTETCNAAAGGTCYEFEDDVNDISFGFGVDLDLGNDLIINAEYGFYVNTSDFFDGDSLELDGLSIGISVPFGF